MTKKTKKTEKETPKTPVYTYDVTEGNSLGTSTNVTSASDAEAPEPKPDRKPKKKRPEKVRALVLVGTLQFEQGTFSKGDIIEVTPERLRHFSCTSVRPL